MNRQASPMVRRRRPLAVDLAVAHAAARTAEEFDVSNRFVLALKPFLAQAMAAERDGKRRKETGGVSLGGVESMCFSAASRRRTVSSSLD
jgi:hypothetical protein